MLHSLLLTVLLVQLESGILAPLLVLNSLPMIRSIVVLHSLLRSASLQDFLLKSGVN